MGASNSSQNSIDMDGPLAQLVKEKIEENCIMIFSKSYCPYCKSAKNVFKDLNVSFEVLELDKHPNGSQLQDILGVMTNAKTVPRVFVGGNCIGGGSETKKLYNSGELKKLIDGCRA